MTRQRQPGLKRYFFSSSACVYRNMEKEEAALTEADAYPALPDNEYGWEKLYAERMAMAYGRRTGMIVRLARFPEHLRPGGTWSGGREKAPRLFAAKSRRPRTAGTSRSGATEGPCRAYTYSTISSTASSG